MPGVVVMRVHVIETGFALQAVGRASTERNIHSRGLCAAVILILEVSVTWGLETSEIKFADAVAIHTAGELKISVPIPVPLFLLDSGCARAGVSNCRRKKLRSPATFHKRQER